MKLGIYHELTAYGLQLIASSNLEKINAHQAYEKLQYIVLSIVDSISVRMDIVEASKITLMLTASANLLKSILLVDIVVELNFRVWKCLSTV